MSTILSALYRHPVKGLSPEPLDHCILEPDAGVPGDRRFALLAGSAPFDALHPTWQPKTAFLTLNSHPRLGELTTRWIAVANTLTIERKGKQVARGDLTSAIGKALIEEFFAAFLKDDGLRPHIAQAQGFGFTDTRQQLVSILTRASLGDLARVAGGPLDERRFRANIILDGPDAWAEDHWAPGQRLTLGAAVLEVVGPIPRCNAPNVNPVTGQVDANVGRLLKGGLGRTGFGIYARVVTGGTVTVGNQAVVPA